MTLNKLLKVTHLPEAAYTLQEPLWFSVLTARLVLMDPKSDPWLLQFVG